MSTGMWKVSSYSSWSTAKQQKGRCPCLWTCEHGHACITGEAGISTYTLISAPCCVQFSVGTSMRRQPWERFTFISREFWDRSSGQGRKGESPPAGKVTPLQGRDRVGEAPPGSVDAPPGQAWMEAGGPPAPASHSSHASPAPSAGKNNAEPPTFARRDPAPPAASPAQIASMASFHLPQGPRVASAEPSPGRGGRTTLSLGLHDEELPSHELPSIFASNISSRLQRSKLSIAHTAYSPSDLLVGNLISLLTCGQSSPSENALQIPQDCVAEWDTAGDRVRWQHQLPSQQVPRKPGCSCERSSGEI